MKQNIGGGLAGAELSRGEVRWPAQWEIHSKVAANMIIMIVCPFTRHLQICLDISTWTSVKFWFCGNWVKIFYRYFYMQTCRHCHWPWCCRRWWGRRWRRARCPRARSSCGPSRGHLPPAPPPAPPPPPPPGPPRRCWRGRSRSRCWSSGWLCLHSGKYQQSSEFIKVKVLS